MSNYCHYIDEVYHRISPHIRNTPVITSPYFDKKTQNSLFLKCENLQYTNSFKVRGAFNKVITLNDPHKILITASAGNHGTAVSFVANKFNMRAIVVLPEFVPKFRIDRIKALGAEVIIHGNTMDEMNAKIAEFTTDPQYVYIHGFDDDEIIAGQATVAYELLNAVPDLDVIISPVGGGGLISGIAKYAKAYNPEILIYGAQPYGADAMYQSLEVNKIISLAKIDSIAISLGVSRVGERTFEIVKACVDDIIRITDESLMTELKYLLEQNKLLIEPASASGLAALLTDKLKFLKNKRIGVILSGGNFSLDQLKLYL